jgi:anthranilate phosphoribosyltransferase
VGVGVQQRHGDALGARLAQASRDLADLVLVLVDRALDSLHGRALVDLEASPVRDQRLRLRRVEVVQGGPGLAAGLQRVPEPGGRHERGRRPAVLRKRVHRYGRRVGERLDLARIDPGPGAGLLDPPDHSDRLVVGRRHLRRDEFAVGEEDHVGERPPDVDAEAGHGSTAPATSGSEPPLLSKILRRRPATANGYRPLTTGNLCRNGRVSCPSVPHVERVMTDAYVHVLVDPGAISTAASRIGEIDAAETVNLVTGEYDVVVEVELDDREELPRVVAEEIHEVSGVVDTITNVAFEP